MKVETLTSMYLGFAFSRIVTILFGEQLGVRNTVYKIKKDPFCFALYGLMADTVPKIFRARYFDVFIYITVLILFVTIFLCSNINHKLKPMKP